ncbi:MULTISPECIES: DNA cytosine methyltransferase [unclassified Exiguobacterium]|uniref:DNA cytosine methyltransferase n=1 Tax=unclassified Exiguobacterium TaxID=2644629 RepID=UPI001BEB87F6|nr:MULTISPECIES: DNA cytosine methyltransferase [unclassified Exiguobacterium]
MKKNQLISLSQPRHRELLKKVESLASKENRSLSDAILELLNIGYSEYVNRSVETAIPFSVVSLFAGAGGLDTGLHMAGFKTVWANEKDKDACETYISNHPNTYVERGDVRNVKSFPEADMVVGGYPCQGFSLAGNRLVADERNFLYKEFVRALRSSNPKFFIAENVKGMVTMEDGRVIEAMVEEFRNQGYQVTYHLVNAKNYGVPQDRERVFIVGVRQDISKNFKYELPLPTHGTSFREEKPYVTLEDVIGNLKADEVGEVYESGFSSRYLSRNRKRSWNEVSFTIQASGRHAPLHPSGEPMTKVGKDEWILPETSKHRRLSAVECALIQTFPKNYVWKGSLGSIYKQIGNAVPCLLSKAIAQPIADYLKIYYNTESIEIITKKELEKTI